MWSVFGIKLQAFSPATVLKRDSSHGCFPVKFAKFFRTPILKNICKLLTASNSFFLMALITILFFSVQAQTEIIEEWWSKSPLCRLYFPQCLRAYNHAENILRLTTIPRITFFLWIIWPFIPFKTPKQTPASKTVYPYPILWGFVIWTSTCAETVIWGPMKTFSKQWTISSILNSYDLYHQVLT